MNLKKILMILCFTTSAFHLEAVRYCSNGSFCRYPKVPISEDNKHNLCNFCQKHPDEARKIVRPTGFVCTTRHCYSQDRCTRIKIVDGKGKIIGCKNDCDKKEYLHKSNVGTANPLLVAQILEEFLLENARKHMLKNHETESVYCSPKFQLQVRILAPKNNLVTFEAVCADCLRKVPCDKDPNVFHPSQFCYDENCQHDQARFENNALCCIFQNDQEQIPLIKGIEYGQELPNNYHEDQDDED